MALADAIVGHAFRRILLATSSCAADEAALCYAALIARRYGSMLFVGGILSPEHSHLVSSEEVPHVIDQERRDAERRLSRLLNSDRVRGIDCESILKRGNVRRVMLELISSYDVDLVVLGTCGEKRLRTLLLGSAAEQILEATNCPVLIVGPGSSRRPTAEPSLNKVLFPTDFSSQAQTALPYALLLARDPAAHLVLLHALEQPPRDHLRDVTGTQHYLEERLRSLIPPDLELPCEPEFLVRFGPILPELLCCAKERSVDVIVMGERRPGEGVAAHLLGETSYAIACRAPCPVLTICSRN